MLTIATWKWGAKYGSWYVSRLKNAIHRHLSMPHRFVCITDEPVVDCECWPIMDPGLLSVDDGCYCRLRMFDPWWRLDHKIERIVCLDLDLIVTGPLDGLFSMPGPFRILHGGHFSPCPFNGSVMAVDRGAPVEIWADFTEGEACRIARQDGIWRGSDQTWLAYKAPKALGWTWRDGIYAWQKPGFPKGEGLPDDARIVAFPGAANVEKLAEKVPWIAENWK